MKILIDDIEFNGVNILPSDNSLTLNVVDEDDAFTKIANLIPTMNESRITIYGTPNTENEELIVAIYQSHQFHSMSRSQNGNNKIITISLQVDPLEVTEADIINQKLAAQEKTISKQAQLLEEQQKIIDSQTEQLESQNKTNILLKAQIQSITERADFVDDCIAEMACEVYA